jgi:hypothetical protein
MNRITPDALGTSLSDGLGALVMWELSDSAITPDDLRALLVSLGEDPSVVPDIDPASAASRASREWGMGRGNETRYRAEVVAKETGLQGTAASRVQVGILERQRVNAAEVKWVQIDSVIVAQDAAGGFVGAYSMGSTSQAESYRSLFLKRLTHLDADWIRPHLIQARLDAVSAFTVRRQGGVVFVDRTHLEEVNRLARIIRKIGDSSFDIVHVARTEESERSITRAAEASLGEAINEITDKLDAWTERAKAPRSDAVAGLLENVGDLVLRSELYRDVLAVTSDALADRLAAVKSRAMALLIDGVEDAA